MDFLASKADGMRNEETKDLRLHVVEQGCLTVEDSKNLVKKGITALYNQRHIFLPVFFSSHLDRACHIMFLLLRSVEPAHEKARTLCLLPTLRAAHVEQDVGILMKKFLFAHQ